MTDELRQLLERPQAVLSSQEIEAAAVHSGMRTNATRRCLESGGRRPL